MDGYTRSSHAMNLERMRLAFFAEDDIGALIRCQYEAERALDHALNTFSGGRAFEKGMFRYFGQKLEILYVMGIGENVLKPVRTINSIRNEFAHHGHENLTEKHLESVMTALSAVYNYKIEDYDVELTGVIKFASKYKDLSLRQKFVVCAMHGIGLLASSPEIFAAKAKEQGLPVNWLG